MKQEEYNTVRTSLWKTLIALGEMHKEKDNELEKLLELYIFKPASFMPPESLSNIPILHVSKRLYMNNLCRASFAYLHTSHILEAHGSTMSIEVYIDLRSYSDLWALVFEYSYSFLKGIDTIPNLEVSCLGSVTTQWLSECYTFTNKHTDKYLFASDHMWRTPYGCEFGQALTVYQQLHVERSSIEFDSNYGYFSYLLKELSRSEVVLLPPSVFSGLLYTDDMKHDHMLCNEILRSLWIYYMSKFI